MTAALLTADTRAGMSVCTLQLASTVLFKNGLWFSSSAVSSCSAEGCSRLRYFISVCLNDWNTKDGVGVNIYSELRLINQNICSRSRVVGHSGVNLELSPDVQLSLRLVRRLPAEPKEVFSHSRFLALPGSSPGFYGHFP